MFCKIADMRRKEVICRNNGVRIGCVDDIEIDTCSAKIISIVIFGRLKCFGLLGRTDDIIISWDNIALIGEDTILVDFDFQGRKKHRPKFFFSV